MSQSSLFIEADNTFLAKPSLIDFAMSKGLDPFAVLTTFPSGKVILICIKNLNWQQI